MRSLCSVVVKFLGLKLYCVGESGMFCLNLLGLVYLRIRILRIEKTHGSRWRGMWVVWWVLGSIL